MRCNNCRRQIKMFARGLCRNCYEKQRQPNVSCDNCGKGVYISQNRQNRNNFNYCSASCMSEHRKANGLLAGDNNPAFSGGPLILNCATCGMSFERARSQYNPSHQKQYCSASCQHKGLTLFYSGQDSPHAGQWIVRPCDSCGRELTRPAWAFREMAFCNRKCFGKWKSANWVGQDSPTWQGGHESYYGANWKRQSRRARARDNHTCQRCGITEDVLVRALDVHHIVKFKSFGGDWKKANLLKNLKSYCHPCHMLVENGK